MTITPYFAREQRFGSKVYNMLESIKSDLKLEQIYGVHCLSEDILTENKIEELK